MQQLSSAQVSPEVPVNENFETLEWAALFGKKQPSTSGLTWAYYGGRWGGSSIADGTVTLTASTTNYVVVLRSSGVVSTSTATTNWNNTALYGRLYKLTTSLTAVTAAEDHRAGPYGVWSEPRKVFVTLVDGATINLDALLASDVKAAQLVLGGNRTLANPTNLVDGARLVIPLKQDATGTRTLAYGSKWKFAGGAPALSTAANAQDLLTGTYDAGTDQIFATLEKAFA